MIREKLFDFFTLLRKSPHVSTTQMTREENTQNQKNTFFDKKIIITIVIATIIVLLTGIVILKPFSDRSSAPGRKQLFDNLQQESSNSSPAVSAGKRISYDRCTGEGVPYKLGRSPMDPEDFSIVIPYGLMIDDHVTPIDHQYFSPKDYNSPLDAYEVYAMGDATLTDIEPRQRNDRGKKFVEYRLVFTVTCTYFYYYDLVTSLSPDIKKKYEESRSGTYNKPLAIKIKEGQLIGRIGGQTLDFAVWDTTKPLSGFVVPEHYNVEPWKLYTADPLDYYTDELKQFILSRYIRTVEPLSGRIDYDIDGKAIGNWFLQGTEGYGSAQGNPSREYWIGQLAIAPDHIDPTGILVSFGDFNGNSEQFIIQNMKINPDNISTKTGVVRYELGQYTYIKPNGEYWDRNSVARNLRIIPNPQPPTHCVLLQLVEDRKLKVEYFTNTTCTQNINFTQNAKYYLR